MVKAHIEYEVHLEVTAFDQASAEELVTEQIETHLNIDHSINHNCISVGDEYWDVTVEDCELEE